MENSFRTFVEGAKSILIILPVKPYFDQVAAGLALYLALRGERNTQVTSPSPMTVEFNRLIGVNKISQEVGNKNLVIRFVDYKATDIERVSYDIEDGQFKLTVIPKDQLTPPTQDQVELAFSGVSADVVILVGGVNESHFPMLSSKEFAGAKLLHMGTKDINIPGKQIISFSRPASSISELVASVLRDSEMGVDEDAATNLIMGLEEATNNLTDPSLVADSFEILAWLMRLGGRRGARVGTSSAGLPPGVIPGLPKSPGAPAWQPPVQPREPQQPPKQVNQQSDTASQSGNSKQQTAVDEDDEVGEEAPRDWLQPKIFKGTSVK